MLHLYSAALIVACILYNANAKVFVNLINNGRTTSLGSYLYYEDSLQNYTDGLKTFKVDNEKLRTNIDLIDYRLSNELENEMNQLLEVKATLEKSVSPSSKKPASNCAEALKDNAQSGIYTLHLSNTDLPPFMVYCLKDPDNGPAWTLLQLRQDGTVDFYRTWNDYKFGFGNFYGEHWLGLEKIYALTHQPAGKQELWIQLEDFDGEERFAKYTDFSIGDEKSKYVLNSIGTYSGDAEDSLKYHVGSKFTTKDSDNDADTNVNCAVQHSGAWWHKSCFDSNLNGKYLRYKEAKDVKQDAKGIEWYKWRAHYSLKYVHMAIRPAK